MSHNDNAYYIIHNDAPNGIYLDFLFMIHFAFSTIELRCHTYSINTHCLSK